MSALQRQVIRAKRRRFHSFISSNFASAKNRGIMSTSPEKSLCTSEDKDERQEKSLETRSTEKGEMPKDERRNLSCDLVKKIYPSDFRNWPILSLLKPEFIIQIRMVMVYGNNGNRALIVTKDKNVYTLDYNTNDNLKTSDTHIGLHPRKIEELCGKNIKTFACNSYFVLALTEEGEVYFWEFNKKRKSDDKSYTSVVSRVTGLSDKYIVDIACGSDHSLALTNNGEVYAWGKNNYGQVGNENSSIFDGSLPRQVKHRLEGQKIVQIACGSKFNVVVTDTGKLYGWGNNESSQILIDNATSSTGSSTGICFASTSTESKLKNVSSSVTHPINLKLTKLVNPTSSISINNPAFSFNSSMPLTAPSLTSSSNSSFGTNVTPSPFLFDSANKVTSNNVELQKYYVYPHEIVISGKVIVKVSCGFEHTLALTDEGKIYAWGKNDKGQRGVNNNLSLAPTMVDIPELIKDIAAYGNLSVAIGNNKIVYVWGDCFGQHINVPFLTEFSRIHDAFAYSESRIMYKPLIVSTNDYDYFEEILNIMKSLKAGFDDPATSDFIVQVEGQRIHVHKAILQIRCQHFKSKSGLQQNWFEDECVFGEDKPIYTVSDKFSYIVYKAFLKYLYTGTIDLPSEDALDLMKLADEYGEINLKKECSRIIEQAIDVSNVALYYCKAIEYNAKELEELCFQFALRHMKDVIVTNNYEKLDITIKYKLLFRAVKICFSNIIILQRANFDSFE